jgi:hypothetical protein
MFTNTGSVQKLANEGQSTEYTQGRDEIEGVYPALSAGAYTATLYVMVIG